MPLFEIKLKLTPGEAKKLIKKLGLVFQKEYSDSDRYLPTRPGEPTKKIKIINGKMRYYELSAEDEIFVIKGRDILEPQEQSAFQNILPRQQIERRKEIYKWPAQNIETAIDYIEGAPAHVFFEAYSHRRQAVQSAQQALKNYGYKTFYTKTYDQPVA